MIAFRHVVWTILVAMIPAVEVKGAIPFGIALGLPPVAAYFCALGGSTVVLCFLAFFTNWFYRYCKRHNLLKRFIGWLDKLASNHREKLDKWGPLAIFTYVAIPIPGTGTWTGAIIAGIFNMKPWRIIASVFCGNIVSGIILSLASNGIFSLIR